MGLSRDYYGTIKVLSWYYLGTILVLLRYSGVARHLIAPLTGDARLQPAPISVPLTLTQWQIWGGSR